MGCSLDLVLMYPLLLLLASRSLSTRVTFFVPSLGSLLRSPFLLALLPVLLGSCLPPCLSLTSFASVLLGPPLLLSLAHGRTVGLSLSKNREKQVTRFVTGVLSVFKIRPARLYSGPWLMQLAYSVSLPCVGFLSTAISNFEARTMHCQGSWLTVM